MACALHCKSTLTKKLTGLNLKMDLRFEKRNFQFLNLKEIKKNVTQNLDKVGVTYLPSYFDTTSLIKITGVYIPTHCAYHNFACQW